MTRSILARVLLAAVAFAPPALADEGMWLVNNPPLQRIKSRYGIAPDAAWWEKMQKSAVRFQTGGSGSLVSPDGLVMTNHHVGRDMIAKLSTKDRDLVEHGFLARTREQELKCPDLELNILWSIEDVTPQVAEAKSDSTDPAQANAARRAKIAEIEKAAEAKSGLKAQVVTLYQGARYHLYEYRRYTDVRLVYAPDASIADFGGDIDNFEFPRFNLDVAFFRIYENDKPLKSEHHLRWSPSGAKAGEPIFVFGHPGSTQRLFTIDHLRFLRDVDLPTRLTNGWRTEIRARTFAGRSQENARQINEDILGFANGRKARTGLIAGLHDPELFARKRAAEDDLRAWVGADADRAARFAKGWQDVSNAQAAHREIYLRKYLTEDLAYSWSRLGTMARTIVRHAAEIEKKNDDRLEEFTDSRLPAAYLDLYSDEPLYDALEVERLERWLSFCAERLGGEDPIVLDLLAGKSPRARAAELVAKTTLRSVEARKALIAGKAAALEQSTDPLLAFARRLDVHARAWRERFENEVEALQISGYAKIASAKFEREGESVYPDATFTLRVSFGSVRGIDQPGRAIAPFTTVAGLYARAEERKGEEDFILSPRWLSARGRLDPATPFNFICTADIIGGNSGSPVVNAGGEVVGLVFDGNIDSLVGNVVYDIESNRCVAVDSRAIIAALRVVEDAGFLADEIEGR